MNTLFTKYRNPWYNRNNSYSKDSYFINSDSKVSQYKSFYIAQGVNPWVDVVEHVEYEKGNAEFVCVSQRGSVKNAREWIDSLESL